MALMGISIIVKYNFNFLNYIVQFCLVSYYGPFNNSNKNKKKTKKNPTQTNKQKRQVFVVSLNLKSPFPTGYIKSGVPTIKHFCLKKVFYLIPISECIYDSMDFHYLP